MTVVAAMIDSREPPWVQQLTFNGAMTTVTQLSYGDLLVTADDGTLLAVERKTASDLLGSIRDGRLWLQLAGMKEQTPWSYLVITGLLTCSADGKAQTERGVTGWSWGALQGALLKAQELGAFIVFGRDDSEYEPTIMRLAAHSRKETVVLQPAKQPAILNESERVLAAMPGIGPEKVGAIMDHTGTLGWALSFLTHMTEEEHIAGIGPATKRGVRAVLGLRDDEDLSVVVADTGQLAKEGES